MAPLEEGFGDPPGLLRILRTAEHCPNGDSPFQQQEQVIRQGIVIQETAMVGLFYQVKNILPEPFLMHLHPPCNLLIVTGLSRDLIKVTALVFQLLLSLDTVIEQSKQLLPWRSQRGEIEIQFTEPFLMRPVQVSQQEI